MGIRASKEFQLRHLKEHLEQQIPRIQSAQVIAAALVERKMGKAQSIADRIKQTRQKLNDDLDEVASKLDGLDAKKPEVMARVHQTIDGMHSEVDGIDSELRQLSNLGE